MYDKTHYEMSCVSVHSTVAFVLLVIIRSSQGMSTMYVMSYYVRSLYYVSRLYYVCMVAGCGTTYLQYN